MSEQDMSGAPAPEGDAGAADPNAVQGSGHPDAVDPSPAEQAAAVSEESDLPVWDVATHGPAPEGGGYRVVNSSRMA